MAREWVRFKLGKLITGKSSTLYVLCRVKVTLHCYALSRLKLPEKNCAATYEVCGNNLSNVVFVLEKKTFSIKKKQPNKSPSFFWNIINTGIGKFLY